MEYKYKTLKEADISPGTRVLLRADFNVPVGSDGRIDETEDWRIRATLPTIEYLRGRGAITVVLAHLGRPIEEDGREETLEPVAKRLVELTGRPVHFTPHCLGRAGCLKEEAEKEMARLKPGDVMMLENLRFSPAEEAADEQFARDLAALGDIFINDAFGVSHRAHASVAVLPKFLPSYAGFLLEKELKEMEQVIKNPVHPLVAIIGGIKAETKLKVVRRLLGLAEGICLGGVLANTVIAAKGYAIGKSFFAPELVNEVKNLEITDTKLHIPVDVVVSSRTDGSAPSSIAPVGKIGEDQYILDVGPETVKLFSDVLKEAKTVVWNGPMGKIDVPEFSRATEDLIKVVAFSGAYSVIGGGETVEVLARTGYLDRINHVSTGGGAMLEFLAGNELPGVRALGKNDAY